jgi:nucleoside-diphosphate-sugar epimerase
VTRVNRRDVLQPVVSAIRVSGKGAATLLKSVGFEALAETGRVRFRRGVDSLSVGSESDFNFYTSRTVFDSSRAQRVLGWQPEVQLQEAMQRTEAWLRFARML